jgi:hypothetical protein
MRCLLVFAGVSHVMIIGYLLKEFALVFLEIYLQLVLWSVV